MSKFLAAFGLFLVTACGAADTSTTTAQGPVEPASSGSVQPGTFKLYPQPRHTPNPSCDIHTSLQLINGFVAPVAVLENKVDGNCEILVVAQKRIYNLKQVAEGCGSKRYVGKKVTEGRAPVAIEIVDHRSRVCRDIVPAQIIATETYSDGSIVKLYSTYKAPAAALTSHTGVLFRMMAIGGESTGFGLTMDDGQVVELDLATNGLAAQFIEDQKVSVQGTVKQVVGVEIPVRNVLEVKSMTVVK